MKTILVPTDFSKNAENACQFAIEIAKETKAKIVMMHAFETPILYSEMPAIGAAFDYKAIHDSSMNKLKRFYEKIKKHINGITIETMLLYGLPSSRIIETALEIKSDLIVMGTTGKGAVEKILMGSNTKRIIKNAPCMVLAVPPKAKYNGLKKIVYTTDLLSDNLRHAEIILPFAKAFNSEILFLTVNTHLSGNKESDPDQIKSKIKKHIHYPKISGYVCDDMNIADGINFFLKKQKIDCLAMYTHHRNILQNIFNHSITKEMIVHLSIPLLVIHEHDFQEHSGELKLQQEKILN